MLDKQEIIESILQADATKDGNSNFLMILIIIIPIILVVVFIMRKKRKQNGENQANVNNKDKSDTNEVWATIKKYLRSIDDKGKEVIDSYVVKRAEPHNLAQMTKQQKIDYKNEQKAIKALKTTNPEQYKIEMERIKKEKRAKPKELYVVLFTTRNAKTLVVDEPRAIECEVRLVKVNKKENRREIDVVRALDYDEEMLWIEPIKAKDDEIYNKRLEADKKKQQKAAERRQKQLEKQKSKTK